MTEDNSYIDRVYYIYNYGQGSKEGIQCKVTIQQEDFGPSFDIQLELTPEDLRPILEKAVDAYKNQQEGLRNKISTIRNQLLR